MEIHCQIRIKNFSEKPIALMIWIIPVIKTTRKLLSLLSFLFFFFFCCCLFSLNSLIGFYQNHWSLQEICFSGSILGVCNYLIWCRVFFSKLLIDSSGLVLWTAWCYTNSATSDFLLVNRFNSVCNFSGFCKVSPSLMISLVSYKSSQDLPWLKCK